MVCGDGVGAWCVVMGGHGVWCWGGGMVFGAGVGAWCVVMGWGHGVWCWGGGMVW